MDFADTPAEAAFRAEVRGWLAEHLTGEFAALGPGGGPADETGWDVRRRVGARARRRPLGRDVVADGVRRARPRPRAADHLQRGVRARANAPARISFFGEGLFAPTLIQFGTDEQKQRFLPKIQSVDELWCQGFSEPNAGSDLANIQTRAVLDGDEWVINGQKVWTTLAHRADWCFVVCRTEPGVVVAPRARRTCWCRWTSPVSRCGRCASSPAAPSSTRCSSTRRAPRRRTCSARSAKAGRSRWRRSVSSAAPPSCRRSSRSKASTRRCSRSRTRTVRPTSRRCATSWPSATSACRS